MNQKGFASILLLLLIGALILGGGYYFYNKKSNTTTLAQHTSQTAQVSKNCGTTDAKRYATIEGNSTAQTAEDLSALDCIENALRGCSLANVAVTNFKNQPLVYAYAVKGVQGNNCLIAEEIEGSSTRTCQFPIDEVKKYPYLEKTNLPYPPPGNLLFTFIQLSFVRNKISNVSDAPLMCE